MKYDVLKINKDSGNQARIIVNDVDLLDLVRKQEIPWSIQEYNERVDEGEEIEGGPEFLAGDYMPLDISGIKYPNSYLLDSPYIPGFKFEEWDPGQDKHTLFWCTCGIPDCWLFRCKITVRGEVVIWSDFECFHRHWQYGFGPFVFEYKQYLNELKNA